MTFRLALALLAAALLAGDAVLLGTAYAYRLRATDRRWVRVGPLRRSFRAWRSRVVRLWLWWASWPHVVHVLLGTRRVRVMTTPREVVWRQGRATLSRIGSGAPRRGGPPVLVVHSVVTRPWILDLLPERSLLAALAEGGHDVFLLDWGEPGRHDAGQGLQAHAQVLREVTAELAARSPTGTVHVVGYCMGGTLALAAAGAWGTGPLASLVLVAPPVDTRVPGGMAAVLGHRALTPVLALDGDGCVPVAVVRESFHLLRREELRYALARLTRRRDTDFQRVASALARWAWEQRRVPGALLFDLVDLFRGDTLLNGTLRLGDDPVDLARIDVPTLVLVTDRDHIVPIASSLALTRLVPHAEVVRCPAGHVSMLMGRESKTVLLPALERWLAARAVTGAAPAARPRAAARDRAQGRR